MKNIIKITATVLLIIPCFLFAAFAQPEGTVKIQGQACSIPDFWVNITTDDSNAAQWHIDQTTVTNIISKTDGRANTNGYAWVPGTAGYICKNKAVGPEGGAWYLPAQEEVNIMFAAYRAGLLSGFNSTGFYWASTEHTAAAAYYTLFSGIRFGNGNLKIGYYNVRCVWRPL